MHLVPGSSQRCKVSLTDGRCGGRLNKSCGVEEGLNAVRAFVGVRIPRDRGVAVEVATHRASRASDRKGEPVLRGENPLSAPSANHCVEPSRHLISKGLA